LRRKLIVVEAEAVHDAGPHALDDHVGRGCETSRHLYALRGFQIER
jgi:hypothetical protein